MSVKDHAALVDAISDKFYLEKHGVHITLSEAQHKGQELMTQQQFNDLVKNKQPRKVYEIQVQTKAVQKAQMERLIAEKKAQEERLIAEQNQRALMRENL